MPTSYCWQTTLIFCFVSPRKSACDIHRNHGATLEKATVAYWTTHPPDAKASAASGIPKIRIALPTGCGIPRRQRFGTYSNFLRAHLNKPLPWRIALTAYLAAVAVVGFWPTPVDKPIFGTLTAALKYLHRHGAPGWFNYHFVESSANVAMFIPLGILAAMALPAKPWWQLAAIGLAASLCMEVGQLLIIAARFASPLDVVMNTCGAVIGIGSARLLTRVTRPKPAKA